MNIERAFCREGHIKHLVARLAQAAISAAFDRLRFGPIPMLDLKPDSAPTPENTLFQRYSQCLSGRFLSTTKPY